MSRILIAGCGDIGSTLGARLHGDGHEVWGLRRSARALPDGMHALRADLTVPESLDILPARLDAAVYIATPDRYDDEAYEAAYVRGLANLVEVLHTDGGQIARLIFVSSTSVYAQNGGQWVDEDSPTIASGFSAKRLLQAEHLALEDPISGLVVRFGGIYGPGRNRLLQRVRDGRPCQQTPTLYTNRIHRDDCVAVLCHLLRLSEPEHIYLAVDSDPAPQCAVMDWLALQMGVPQPPRLDSKISRDTRSQSNKRCRNARLLASGYQLIYPSYRDGYAAILRDSCASARD
jgi:nucleoside-diphosphate-sugar epimerase